MDRSIGDITDQELEFSEQTGDAEMMAEQGIEETKGLIINPDTHTYYWDGEKVPSVTEILRKVGIIQDNPYYTEESRDRGKAVHLACKYYCENRLDEDSLSDDILPYFEAFKLFLDDAKFRPDKDCIEKPLYHPQYRFAGTPDLIGCLNGVQVCIDIKTGEKMPYFPLQLAGYELLLKENDFPVEKPFALQLKKTGKPNLIPYDTMTDIDVFLACLSVYYWRRENGTL